MRAWLAAAGAPAPDRLMRLDLEELGSLLLHYAALAADAAPTRRRLLRRRGEVLVSDRCDPGHRGETRPAETGDRRRLHRHLAGGRHFRRGDQCPAGRDGDVQHAADSTTSWRRSGARWTSARSSGPRLPVRLNMAMWFASLQFLLFSWICRHRMTDQGRTGLGRWLLCLVAGVAEVLSPTCRSIPGRCWARGPGSIGSTSG